MKKGILYTAKMIKKRDPAAKSLIGVMLLYPGFHAFFWHKVAHRLYKMHLKGLARWLSMVNRFFTGIEIHPGAQIGGGLFIDHGMGIVIGETAIVGEDCTIYHGVTLGGTGHDKGKRHPTIGNNVLIGAGAKILGPFTVGDNARIGAGSVVLEEVEPGMTVAGTKARAVKSTRHDDGTDERPSDDLDQVHLPDPVAQELCKIKIQIEKLEKELAEAKNQLTSQVGSEDSGDTTEVSK